MRVKYPTFHVPPGPEGLPLALTWLREWPGAQDGVIVTSTKDQFTDGILAGLLGAVGEKLAAGHAVRLGSRQVRGASLRTFRSLRSSGGPVLAVWLDEKDLGIFDDAKSIEALCAVPWVADEITSWVKATGALNLLDPTKPPPSASIGDPVVLEAMQWLTGVVNLSTGLAHPNDKSRAVGAFRLLKKGRHAWVPEEIHAWALANGWKSRHAEQLRDLAERIAAGKSVRVRDASIVSSDHLELWRRRAGGASE